MSRSPGFNARTRVHEYGGAPYCVHQGTIFFSNFSDQRVYRQVGEAVVPITSEGYFYADGCVDATRAQLLLVREDHTTRLTRADQHDCVGHLRDGSREVILEFGRRFLFRSDSER